MRVLMINAVCGIRSTGRICTDLASVLEEQGYEVKIAYGRGEVPEQFQKYAVRIGSDLDIKLHVMKARVFDNAGFGSKQVTERFINWIREYDPDIIHLHNIHGYYINIEVLFQYLKTCGKRIIWTLHDCWAYTGHCCYYSMANCSKWEKGCSRCKQKRQYPSSIIIDQSKNNYRKKKELFSGIKDMYLVTPSIWLKKEVEKSFLNEYPVIAIPNGIDLSKYKRTIENKSDIFHLRDDKYIILGVASTWSKRKGLADFLKLSKLITDDYLIVLVGLDKKTQKKLPSNILGINNTNSIMELVAIYSAADVFVNPSVEETMGLTSVESIACGTPSIVYNCTALPEVIDQYAGEVVEPHDINRLWNTIKNVISNKSNYKSHISAQKYEKKIQFNKYISLYVNN